MIVKKIGKKNKNALLTIKDTINLLSYTKFYSKNISIYNQGLNQFSYD